jgi:hypothetical protein
MKHIRITIMTFYLLDSVRILPNCMGQSPNYKYVPPISIEGISWQSVNSCTLLTIAAYVLLVDNTQIYWTYGCYSSNEPFLQIYDDTPSTHWYIVWLVNCAMLLYLVSLGWDILDRCKRHDWFEFLGGHDMWICCFVECMRIWKHNIKIFISLK